MTNTDLRLQYKRDTGNNADIKILQDIDLDRNLTLNELNEPIEMEFYVDFDDVPYLEWLEEQLIKSLTKQ